MKEALGTGKPETKPEKLTPHWGASGAETKPVQHGTDKPAQRPTEWDEQKPGSVP